MLKLYSNIKLEYLNNNYDILFALRINSMLISCKHLDDFSFNTCTPKSACKEKFMYDF